MVIYFMKFVKIQNVRYIQRNGQRLLELKKLSLSLSHSRFTNCWRAEVFVRRISQLLNPPCLSLWSYAGYNISFKKNMFFNFSWACRRGQILLIKSIPTINKVFFPVLQRKQFVVLSILLQLNLLCKIQSLMVMVLIPRNSKNKDCAIFSYCDLKGHIVDKCYRVHGFPLDIEIKEGEEVKCIKLLWLLWFLTKNCI